MDDDEGQEDEGPLFAWLPPEDRLWRHPSEMAGRVSAAASGRPNGPAGHIWTVAMAAGVVGALVASAVLIATGTMHAKPVKEFEKVRVASPVTTAATGNSALDSTVAWSRVASLLAPEVVAVYTTLGQAQGEVGSGVVYGTTARGEADIVTADDLLSPGGTAIVAFDDRRPQKAKIVGRDMMTGLAVLSVKTTDPDPADFGYVSSLSLAQPILTVGARQADDTPYAPGVIGGVDDSVTSQSDTTMVSMLEVRSGATIPDNLDGGAVVDQNGNVMGIYTAAASGGSTSTDEAYALPSDLVQHVAKAIVSGQKLTHPWIGIGSATDVTATSGAQRGSPVGVSIGSICPGSPAAETDLADNDIITSIGATKITTSGELVSLVTNEPIGRSLRVGYHAPQGPTRQTWVTVANEPGTIAC